MNKLMNRRSSRQTGCRSVKRQAGVTLMETMIALALSAVVTSAMVILMANSLGTATRVIHMSQLTDELRNAMSMMTRDARRANHSAYAIFCYGNSDCGVEGGVAEQYGDIAVNDEGSCFTYTLDRGFDGSARNDPAGGFRRVAVDGVGVIQMWTGGGTADCSDGPGAQDWIAVTDPDHVNVTQFVISDAASISKVFEESETKSFTSRQRQIQITLEGNLVLEEALANTGELAETVVRRRIEDIVFVRNDFIIL